MSKDKGIAFIIRSYLHFLCGCFLRGFLRTILIRIIFNQIYLSQRFGLVSLFNGISTFAGYLMPKPFS